MIGEVGLQDLGDGLAGGVAGVEADLHAEALLRHFAVPGLLASPPRTFQDRSCRSGHPGRNRAYRG